MPCHHGAGREVEFCLTPSGKAVLASCHPTKPRQETHLSMRHPAVPLICMLLSMADARAHAAAWTPGGVPVNIGSNEVQVPRVLADGTGGAYVLWGDFRNPNEPPSNTKSDVYGLRLTPAGMVGTGWPSAGLGIATRLGNDTPYGAVLDGAGGLYVLWGNDRGDGGDIQLQRLTGAGEVAPGWPDTGLVLSTRAGWQLAARMVPDGSGGVHVVWFDDPEFPTQGTAYRTHVRADGTLAPGWPVGGRRHQPTITSTYVPALLPLPDGGFYAAWAEFGDVGWYASARLVGARYDASGEITAGWPAAGVELCPMLPHSRAQVVLADDGAGGCFAVWSDERRTWDDFDIYAQHLLATASVDSRWPASGAVLSAIANRNQWDVVACEDGAGGFIAAWEDYRIQPSQVHALRMRADGTRHPAWPADGLRFSPADAFQLNPRITADGMGGAYIAWNALSLYYQVHVQRLGPLGLPAAGWPVGGARVFDYPAYQNYVALDTDAQGGAIVAWEDGRGGPSSGLDIYAQRYLGGGLVSARVSLVGAEAVPDEVRLEWRVEGEAGARLERREGASEEWRAIAALSAEGDGRMRYTDREVTPGMTLAYRLTFADGTRGAEVSVQVPVALAFALEGAQPNPARGHVELAYTLAEPGEARVELLDAAGRRVAGETRRGAASGRHRVRFAIDAQPPGLYWAVLTQGSRRESQRVVVVR